LPQDAVFPPNVSSSQVMALLKSVKDEGGKVDAAKLADDFGFDLKSMLPILNVAEMLGLITVDGGDITLTSLGSRIIKEGTSGFKLLKDNISRFEPFKTALELSKKSSYVTSREISEALKEKGIVFSEDEEENENMVEAVLVHWAIYANMLKYNGKTAVFSKASD